MSGSIAARRIHHFGPDPAYVGGMGTVIRVLAEHRLGAEEVLVHPTWRANSRLRSIPLALREALRIPAIGRSEIVHVHLAERGALVREGAVVVLARLLGRATVVTIHGSGFLAYARRHRRLAATVLRRAHLITCLDRDVLALVRQLAPRAHSEILPNPVAMDERSSSAAESGELALFAGLVGLRKGADVLGRAWKLVIEARPEARCVVVGPAGDFELPPIAGLTVRGPVGGEEISRLIRSARVIALPSRAEGMPMILTEAMSAGRPFVSTPVGGIPQLARQGGILVGVGEHAALARALIELLGNPSLAASIGERGRRFCLQTRSVEVIDARLRELYGEALRRSTRRSPSR